MRSFVLMVIAQGLYSITGYGMLAFITSFYLRNQGDNIDGMAAQVNAVFGWSLAGVGVLGPVLGVLGGLAGIVGAVCSGAVTDVLVARDKRHYGYMGAIPQIVAFPLFLVALYAASLPVSLFFLTAYLVFQAMPGPAFWSGVQGLAPARTRATARSNSPPRSKAKPRATIAPSPIGSLVR